MTVVATRSNSLRYKALETYSDVLLLSAAMSRVSIDPSPTSKNMENMAT